MPQIYSIWMFTSLLSPGASPIWLECCLQPDWHYEYISIDLHKQYMLYYDQVNQLVIVRLKWLTKTNILDEMACGYRIWDPRIHCCENTAPSLKPPTVMCQHHCCSQNRPPSCAELSVDLKFEYSISQIPLDFECTFIPGYPVWNTWECCCCIWELLAQFLGGLYASAIT